MPNAVARLARRRKQRKDERQTDRPLTRLRGWWHALPPKSRIAFSLFFAAALGAAAITLGSAEIRSGYQQKRGHDSYALAFLALQVGTFVAAVFLTYSRLHLYARRWRALTSQLLVNAAARKAAVSVYTELVGLYNGQLDLRAAMLAEAGHHVGISADDVLRQISLARHWETLASREPVTEQLFVNEPQGPQNHRGDQLAADLIGIAPLPVFTRKSTEPLHTRRKTLRDQLNQLRQERRDAWRATLRPNTPNFKIGDQKVEAKRPDADAPKRNGHVEVTKGTGE